MHVRMVERIDPSDAEAFDDYCLGQSRPAQLSGAVASWGIPPLSFELLSAAAGGIECGGYVDLPRDKPPNRKREQEHRRVMRLGEWIDLILEGRRTSLVTIPFAAVRQHSGVDLAGACQLPCGREGFGSMWLASEGAQIGFHYDYLPNYIVQLRGHRTVLLAGPEQSRHMRPQRSTKCQSEIGSPLRELPAEASCERVDLAPLDLLYIPPLTWHYLVADEPSIAMNLFVGETVPARAFARNLIRNYRPRDVLDVARDAVAAGLLSRRHNRQVLSHAPTGELLLNELLGREPNLEQPYPVTQKGASGTGR